MDDLKRLRSLIIRKITEDVDSLTNVLTSGSMKSMEEYKTLVGKIHGFIRAGEIVGEVFDRYQRDMDNE